MFPMHVLLESKWLNHTEAANFFALWVQVGIYPAAKVPTEAVAQVLSGDYILWNSLGRYPHVAPRRN